MDGPATLGLSSVTSNSTRSCFTIAQYIKFLTSWHRERRWDLEQLIDFGAMPSSHSSTAIGFQDGFGGPLFDIAWILASVVLNQIVYELPAEHPLAETRPLHELLGHTPPQVIAGGLLVVVTASLGHMIILACS